MRPARCRIVAKTDMGKPTPCTITIDRGGEHAIFSVRPLRRRRAYSLPLATVAEMVTWRVLQGEHQAKQDEKKARKIAKAKRVEK